MTDKWQEFWNDETTYGTSWLTLPLGWLVGGGMMWYSLH